MKSMTRASDGPHHGGWRRLGLLATLFLASTASGQTVTASLTGSLADPDGLPVPAASVVATHTPTSARYATTSNEIGLFSLSGLTPGLYSILVERPGFKTLVTNAVALETGQTVHLRLSFETGGVEERVLVEYRPPTLQTESAVVGEVVTGYTASSLPLRGRNVAQLALLLPGVVTTAPASFAQPKVIELGRPYVNGHREQGNSFLLDGVEVNEPVDNLQPYQPSPEAVEEIRFETNNYSAEHGGLAGAIVHAVLKSGTNTLRGSVFELFRHDRLSANRWESKRNGVRKDGRRQHTFGGTLGGPIRENRLFFFADYQGLIDAGRPQVIASLAPAEWRRGDFSGLLGQVPVFDPQTGEPFPGNVIPEARIHPVARAILTNPVLHPLPNRPGWDSNLVSSGVDSTRSHQGDLKLTHLTPRDRSFFRLSYQDHRAWGRLPALPSLGEAISEGPFLNGVLSWDRAFRVSGLSQASVGYSHITYRQHHRDWAGLGAANVALGLEDSQSTPGLSAFQWGSSLSTGNLFRATDRTEQIVSVSERLSRLQGRHNFKAGGQWLYSRIRSKDSGYGGVLGLYTFTGRFTGLGFSDFLLGLVSAKRRGGLSAPWEQRQHRIGLFVEDSFKAKPDLTLNLGLRWSFFSPWVEVDDRQVNFDVDSGRPRFAGRDGNRRALYEPYYGGFEPRLGLAWRARDRLVVRAGYGIVQSVEGAGASSRLPQNPPFFLEVSASYDGTTGPGGFGFSDVAPRTDFLGSLNLHHPRLKPQLTQQWNLFLEQALTDALTVNLGYVGHKATRMTMPRDFNQPLPGKGPPEDWPPAQERRPFYPQLPAVERVTGVTSEGRSNYHALQAIARQRLAKGLEFRASYTWSKAMSDNVGYYGGGWGEVAIPGFLRQNDRDPSAEYGPSFFDVSHNVVLSGSYELPESLLPGWKIDSILTARTGFPLTVIDSRSPSLQSTQDFERPDRVGDGRVSKPILDRWIDATAFKPAAPGTFGNSGVGILRAPGYFMWDLGLSRGFRFDDRRRLTLKLQAFNVLNHPNFGYPGRDLAAPFGFGKITSSIDVARQIELSLKLEF